MSVESELARGYVALTPGTGPNARIAEMIQKLAQQTNNLKRMSGKIGTSGDTPEFRAAMEKNRHETKELCHAILERLKTNKSADKQMFDKLRKNFEQALKAYEDVAKDIEHKQQSAVDRSSKSSASGGAASGRKKRGAPNRKDPEDLETGRGGYDESLLEPKNKRSNNDNGDGDQYGDQEIQFEPYDVEQLEKRREDIAQLERDVLDVADMFKDLALMVDQQQDGIDTIAANITDAKHQAEQGAGELDQAEDYQKRARRKKCCLVFLVLIVLTLVVVGVVVLGK